MKKKNIMYGIMLVVAFLMSSASFASPFTSDASSAFILAVGPSVITPGGVYTVAMAGGGSDSETADKNCTADCYIDKRRQVVANFYQSNVDLDRTVIACGFESTPIETPTKVPVPV